MKLPPLSVTLLAGFLLAGCASQKIATNSDGAKGEIRTYPDRVLPGMALRSDSPELLLGSTAATPHSAPTLNQPLTAGAFVGIGSGAGPEISTGSRALTAIPRADESLRNAPLDTRNGVLNTAASDLPGRVRQALTTGRPDSITRLSSERVERFEIDALNGTVTLRGDVRSETERLMIANRIAAMDGVREVNNQLRVVSPTRHGIDGTAAPEGRSSGLQLDK